MKRFSGTRLLLIAFVVIAVVGGAVTTLIRNNRPPDPTPELQPYLFPEVEPTNITYIVIANQKTHVTRELTKIPGGWKIRDEQNRESSVNFKRIPQILQILSILRYNRVLKATEPELTSYGLADGGRFSVKFHAAGKDYTLIIGDINPTSTLSYVQLDPKGSVFMTDYNSIGLLINVVDSDTSTPVGTPTGALIHPIATEATGTTTPVATLTP